MHRLSIREKRDFYSGMARLIRSGTSLPNALELLGRDAPRGVTQFVGELSGRVLRGDTLADAMLSQRLQVSELEAGIVNAASRGGRLDHGCDQLGRYFDALEKARVATRKRLVYPAVLLHLAVFTLALPGLFLGSGGARVYLENTIGLLIAVYAALALGVLLWDMLSLSARSNAMLDGALGRMPAIGAVRRNFALARFFATLDAQLEASVNIWEAFGNAARASDSGRMMRAARRAMPVLQGGERLSEALSREKVIPVEFIRTFRVAEESGELAGELPRLAEAAEAAAVASLERWSEWLPKLVYGMVLLYIAYQAVNAMHVYVKMLDQVGRME